MSKQKNEPTRLDMSEIALRCYREINHSTNLEMLEVAKKYYSSFVKLLSDKNVNEGVIAHLCNMFTLAYNRRYRHLAL